MFRSNAEHQRAAIGRDEGLLVMVVTSAGPAAAAGVVVGDVLLDLDGRAIRSPEDLLDLLVGDLVGRQATLRLLRGGTSTDVAVTIGERPAN